MSNWILELAIVMQERKEKRQTVAEQRRQAANLARFTTDTFVKLKSELDKYCVVEVVDDYEANSNIALLFKEQDEETFAFRVEIRAVPDLGYRNNVQYVDQYGEAHNYSSHESSSRQWFDIGQLTEEE